MIQWQVTRQCRNLNLGLSPKLYPLRDLSAQAKGSEGDFLLCVPFWFVL